MSCKNNHSKRKFVTSLGVSSGHIHLKTIAISRIIKKIKNSLQGQTEAVEGNRTAAAPEPPVTTVKPVVSTAS